ncbi:MAG: hypothetical protein AB1632_01580 [Nitrospirota bacterium]
MELKEYQKKTLDQVEWQELNKEFSKGIEIQVIDEKEWQRRINEIFMV